MSSRGRCSPPGWPHWRPAREPEPTAALSPGQIAVLAAACEDPAVSARLLDAVTDAPAHAARAARAARAAALLHTVARSTSGSDALPAVLRTLDAVRTS